MFRYLCRRRTLMLILCSISAVMGRGCQQTPVTIAVPPPVPLSAPLSLTANVLTVDTGNLTMIFNGASVSSIVNKATGESYIAQPGPVWFSVNMLNPVQESLTAGSWALTKDPASNQNLAQISYSDSGQTAALTVGIDPRTDEIFLRTSGQSTTPGVLSVFWGMLGFDFRASRLVIPGQAGIFYASNTSPDSVGLDYPTHWESGMVVYEAPKGSLLIYANDAATPQFKGLRASRLSGNLDFGFEMYAVAPWINAVSTPVFEWRMKGFAGDWKVPAAYYKTWWSTVAPHTSAAAPAWTQRIRGVITMTSLDLPTLEAIATQVVPGNTLLYLVSWRLAGYDINYPDYSPAPGAQAYIARAHQLGFHVMLHTNLLGASQTNPGFPLVQGSQLLTPDSQSPMGWPFNLAPGASLEFAFISPNSAAYRHLWINNVNQAVQQLHPDALHLDAGGTIVNDGNGLVDGQNTMQGMIQFQQQIQAAFPNLALGYESITAINSPFIQFAQRWSEDVRPHPISTFLFGDRTFFYGFLDQPHPDDNRFISYLMSYEGQGILPTARIGSLSDFDATQPRMSQLLHQFNIWQTKQFVPDWTSNWNGALFRYKSLADSSVAELDQTNHLITLNIDNTPFYQRLISSSNYSTPLFVRNWSAFDDSTLYGLDPSAQYWLDTGLARPDSLPHLSNIDPSLGVNSQTFVNSSFGMFGLSVNEAPSYDFIGNFYTAAKGTMFLVPYLVHRGMILGAVAETSPVTVGGKAYEAAIVMQPPYQSVPDGVVYSEFTVPLPNTDQVHFNFQVAINDSPIRKDPATFVIWVNGVEVWRKYVGVGAWSVNSIDLSSFKGQTVKLRLISGPGPNNNPIDDVTCWGGLSITTNQTRPGSQFVLHMPPGTGASAFLPSVSTSPIAGQDSAFNITLNVPGQLLAFSTKPPQLSLGADLLDSPFTKFTSTFAGLPATDVNDQNGILLNNVSMAGTPLPRAIFNTPPANGRFYLTWTTTLPPAASQLSFLYGLMDLPPAAGGPSPAYTGVDFLVLINGQQVFVQPIKAGGVNSASVKLTSWAGRSVVIQLAVDADGTALFDSSVWSKVIVN